MVLPESPPTRIGLYTVQRRIGAGGMGVVYLAVSPSGREAAIKVVRRQYADQPEFRARFEREVAAARRVSGAFTAPVIDADPAADEPWLATLYVPAPSLAEQVEAHGPLSAQAVWDLARGLAEALRDIHRAGLVHRDLKPANVLMADDGPRVIDFGISRVPDAAPMTSTHKVMGTPPFMAPEQLRSARDAGPSADMFALGSVLTFAATGHGPFDADTPYAIAYKVVEEDPDLTGVPAPLTAVITTCLRKNPQERPSAEELLHLLGSRSERRSAHRELRRRRPHPARPWLAATAALLLVCGSAFAVWKQVHGQHNPAGQQATTPPATLTGTATSHPVIESLTGGRPEGWAVWTSQTLVPALERDSGIPLSCQAADTDVVCSNQENSVYLLNGKTGKIRWSRTDLLGPRVLMTSPGTDRMVVEVDHSTRGGQDLIGLDLTQQGKTRWTTPNTTSLFTHFIAPDSASNSSLPAVRNSKLVTVNPADGTTTTHGPSFLQDAQPVASFGRFTFLLDSKGRRPGHLFMNDPDSGHTPLLGYDPGLVSQGANGLPVLVAAAPLDSNTVYLVSNAGLSNAHTRLFVIDTRRGRMSSVTLPDTPSGQAAIVGDRLITLRVDGQATGTDIRTGRTVWQTQLPAVAMTNGSGPVPDGNHVLLPLAGGRIASLDPAHGTVEWESAARNNIGDPPEASTLWIVPIGGRVVGETTLGQVYCLTPPS